MRFVGNLFYGGGLGEPRGTLDVQWFSLNQFDGAEFMQWTSMDNFFDPFWPIWIYLVWSPDGLCRICLKNPPTFKPRSQNKDSKHIRKAVPLGCILRQIGRAIEQKQSKDIKSIYSTKNIFLVYRLQKCFGNKTVVKNALLGKLDRGLLPANFFFPL
jgi:hypothetical protein